MTRLRYTYNELKKRYESPSVLCSEGYVLGFHFQEGSEYEWGIEGETRHPIEGGNVPTKAKAIGAIKKALLSYGGNFQEEVRKTRK